MNLQYFPMDRQLCYIEIESCESIVLFCYFIVFSPQLCYIEIESCESIVLFCLHCNSIYAPITKIFLFCKSTALMY